MKIKLLKSLDQVLSEAASWDTGGSHNNLIIIRHPKSVAHSLNIFEYDKVYFGNHVLAKDHKNYKHPSRKICGCFNMDTKKLLFEAYDSWFHEENEWFEKELFEL